MMDIPANYKELFLQGSASTQFAMIPMNLLRGTPTMFDYKLQADNESMYNTPPTFGVYIASLVKGQGADSL